METVRWRAPMPRPSGEVRISIAARRRGRLAKGSPMPMKTRLSAGDFGRAEHLADDFGGGEVAAPTVEAAGAEAAAVSATDLAGNTKGEAA